MLRIIENAYKSRVLMVFCRKINIVIEIEFVSDIDKYCCTIEFDHLQMVHIVQFHPVCNQESGINRLM